MDPLIERRTVAEAELLALAGGESLCTISRSVGPVDGAKHAEGRLVALTEVGRSVGSGANLREATTSALDTWRTHLDLVRDHDRGSGWIAYRAGGVDELEALLGDLAD